MKKTAKLLAVAAVLVLALTACGSKDTTTETEAEEVPELELGKVTKLGQYKGLKLTKESDEVTDEELETTIQSILDANSDYAEVERAALDGDRVNIDYVGVMDGEEFDGGSAENYYLTLGSGTFIDGFEDGLIGAKAGEMRKLDLTFPKDYYSEDLAGQDVTFTVTVNSVEEMVRPELDDDFVQEMSDFNTVDEFVEDLRNEIRTYKEDINETALQREALQTVADASTFDLVEDTIEQNLEYNLDSMEYMAEVYGMTLDELCMYGYGMSTDEMRDYLRESIIDQMKQTMIVEEIAEKEDLTLTDEDLQYTADKLYEDLDDLKENDSEYLEGNAIAYKVANFIIENAEVTVMEPEETREDAGSEEDADTEEGGDAEEETSEEDEAEDETDTEESKAEE